MLGAIALVLMRDENEWGVALTFAALAGSFLVSYTRARAEALGLSGDVGLGSRAERVVVITTGLVLAPLHELVLPSTIALLAATAWLTVVQRVLAVRAQLRERGGATTRCTSSPASSPSRAPSWRGSSGAGRAGQDALPRGPTPRIRSRATSPSGGSSSPTSRRSWRSCAGRARYYNTYWIRFPRGDVTWDTVVANTRVLLRAAREAGVRRVVQFSVTNADDESPTATSERKALAERKLRESGLSHAVVRPTLVFGPGDILMNNIAWGLRRFPVFLVSGGSGYEVQPIAAGELAALAVDSGPAPTPPSWTPADRPASRSRSSCDWCARPWADERQSCERPLPRCSGCRDSRPTLLGDVLVTREELGALRESLLVAQGRARRPDAHRRVARGGRGPPRT